MNSRSHQCYRFHVWKRLYCGNFYLRSMPHLSPLLCLTSHSPPSCVLEDTDMLVKVCVTFAVPAVLIPEKNTGDMFCLHETLKQQTAQEIIRETEERTAEPSSSCGKMFLPAKICVFPGGMERMRRRLAVARRQGWYMWRWTQNTSVLLKW